MVEDPAALQALRELSARSGVQTPGVPTIVVGETVLVGFERESTGARVRAALAGLSTTCS